MADAEKLGIPPDWEGLTPGWMTTALGASFPGVEVTDVEVLLRDDGTNRRARLGLTYADVPGPAVVFLKAPNPRTQS